MIAEAKIKTDKVDARVLAELLAADYLPSVWQADEATKALRRQVGTAHRAGPSTDPGQESGAGHLGPEPVAPMPRSPTCSGSKDVAGWETRKWPPTNAERPSLLRQLDFAGEELKLVDAELARFALDDVNARRLMTIPGVDMAVAVAIVATVGDFSRFESPDKLVSYVGLNPSVRQSGGLPCHPWPDLQARPGMGEGHAGRGGPRGQPHPRAPPRVLRAGQSPPGMADRHGRGGPKTVGDLLAHDPRPTRLRVLPAVAGGQEDPSARAARRGASRIEDARPGPPPPTTSEPSGTDERALGEQAEAAYNHLTRQLATDRPDGKTQPASPKRARQPSVPTTLCPGRQGCPCGRLRRP